MPKAALTGTQKKGQKFAVKAAKEREKLALPVYKDLLKGKHMPTRDLKTLVKDFERAGRGAEKIFAPIQEQALSQFGQYTEPQLATQFSGGTAGSSAMNQALAAARGNLQQGLASDFASLQANLAQNLLSQRESGKTNQLSALTSLSSGMNPSLQNAAFMNPYQQKASKQGPDIGGAIGGVAQGAGNAYLAWQLAKAAAAPATGGVSLLAG